MPEAFLEAGYQTAMVGKWHLGHAQQTYHPNARGYEHFYGHLHTAGERFSLDHKLFFAAEMTVPGTLMTTVFDDEWKLVQRIVQTQLTTDVTQQLFRINDDPYERNNLAAAHPDLVANLSEEVVRWRLLHPIGGTPRGIVPPPGWRAPRDWASYPIPIEDLLDEPAPGMAPPALRRVLDWQHGEQGRVIYGCESYAVLGGEPCE